MATGIKRVSVRNLLFRLEQAAQQSQFKECTTRKVQSELNTRLYSIRWCSAYNTIKKKHGILRPIMKTKQATFRTDRYLPMTDPTIKLNAVLSLYGETHKGSS